MPGQKRKRTTRNTPRKSRKMTLSRAPRGNKVHMFSRWVRSPGSFTGAAGQAPYFPSVPWSFAIENIACVTDFQNLFDQYKITYIQAKFYLKIDPSAQSASSASYPRLYYVRDYTDATPPTSLDQLREFEKTRSVVMNPNKPVVIGFKPAIALEIARTSTSTQFGPKWKQWLDFGKSPATAPMQVQHYGLKWGIDDLTNTNYRVDTEVKMWFHCKGVM